MKSEDSNFLLEEIQSEMKKRSLSKDVQEQIDTVVDEIKKRGSITRKKTLEKDKEADKAKESPILEQIAGVKVYNEDTIPEKLSTKRSTITALSTADVVIRITEYSYAIFILNCALVRKNKKVDSLEALLHCLLLRQIHLDGKLQGNIMIASGLETNFKNSTQAQL